MPCFELSHFCGREMDIFLFHVILVILFGVRVGCRIWRWPSEAGHNLMSKLICKVRKVPSHTQCKRGKAKMPLGLCYVHIAMSATQQLWSSPPSHPQVASFGTTQSFVFACFSFVWYLRNSMVFQCLTYFSPSRPSLTHVAHRFAVSHWDWLRRCSKQVTEQSDMKSPLWLS